MDLGLNNRVAIVTGASKGLGRAVARGLALEGARVLLNSRRQEEVARAADEIAEETGAETMAVAGDVRPASMSQRLVDQAVGRWGRLDVLVANAGGPPPGGLDDLPEEAYLDALELNLLSTVHLTRAAVPEMRKGGWGRIVAITSVSVKQPVPGLLLSNMARPGVIGFLKTISRDLAADGILCNSAAPGYIATDRVAQLVQDTAERSGLSEDEVRSKLTADIPMGRMGDPKEFADAVVFLASERSAYVTGHTMQIDGGLIRGIL